MPWRSAFCKQLMIILEEKHQSLVFIEHDPMLYEKAQEMTEYVSQAMHGPEF